MEPPYVERMKIARARLAAALAPETAPERSITEWIAKHDESTMAVICDMVERVGRRAYDRGYAEGRTS